MSYRSRPVIIHVNPPNSENYNRLNHPHRFENGNLKSRRVDGIVAVADEIWPSCRKGRSHEPMVQSGDETAAMLQPYLVLDFARSSTSKNPLLV